MIQMFKAMLPGWLWALILCVVACVGAGFSLWEETHSVTAVVIGLAAVIIGPGVAGVYGFKSSSKLPPTDPTATAPVTP